MENVTVGDLSEQEVLFLDIETDYIKEGPLVMCKAAIIQYLGFESWVLFEETFFDWSDAISLFDKIQYVQISATPTDDLQRFKQQLRDFLSHPNKRLIGFNIQFDLMVLLKFLYPDTFYMGQPLSTKASQYVRNHIMDLSIILRHVHSGFYKNALSDWCERIFNFKLDKTLQKTNWAQTNLTLNTNKIAYLKMDVLVLVLLFTHIRDSEYTWVNSLTLLKGGTGPFNAKIRTPFQIYGEMEQPFILETVDMALRGLRVDLGEFFVLMEKNSVDDALQAKAQALNWECEDIVDEIISGPSLEKHEDPEANWALSQPFPRTGRKQLSFSFDTLSIWYGRLFKKTIPNIELLLELIKFRNTRKESNTLLKNIRVEENGQWVPLTPTTDVTARAHIFFQTNLMGTKTGRVTTSRMNVIGLSHKGGFRKTIKPSKKGHTFFVCDIKQAEVRIFSQLITAYFGQDNLFCKLFKNNLDWHTSTAAYIMDKNEKDVTKTERNLAKRLNFGLLYLMGPVKLREHLAKASIFKTKEEVQRLHDKWHEKHYNIKEFVPVLQDLFLQSPYIEGNKAVFQNQPAFEQHIYFITSFAGRRKMSDYKKSNLDTKIPTTEIVNYPVQATCTDILIECWRRSLDFPPDEGRIVLSAYDEFIFEVADNKVDTLQNGFEKIVQEVSDIYLPDVGLEIETFIDDYWGKP